MEFVNPHPEERAQTIQESFPEEHIRIIQTAIAVIKGDPESLPIGEPQSFAEKWLRKELEEVIGEGNW
jgi:hypothetical protein